jgi:hypothetical protein
MFTEDLTAFFSTGDFAVDATWTPAAGGGPYTVQVIFENAYQDYPLGEADQAGRVPQCWASDTQLAQGSGMKRGDALVINGTSYKVGTVEPDGTGVSRIVLRT